VFPRAEGRSPVCLDPFGVHKHGGHRAYVVVVFAVEPYHMLMHTIGVLPCARALPHTNMVFLSAHLHYD